MEKECFLGVFKANNLIVKLAHKIYMAFSMLQREADEREKQRREAERREIQLKAAKEKLDQLRQTTIGAKVFNDMDEEVSETFISFLLLVSLLDL